MPIISYYWMRNGNETNYSDCPLALHIIIILCLAVLAISFIYI